MERKHNTIRGRRVTTLILGVISAGLVFLLVILLFNNTTVTTLFAHPNPAFEALHSLNSSTSSTLIITPTNISSPPPPPLPPPPPPPKPGHKHAASSPPPNKTQKAFNHVTTEKVVSKEILASRKQKDRSPTGEKPNGICDVFDGQWVYDEQGQYPLYSSNTCPFIDDAFNCQFNGRPDSSYLKWRWQPTHCFLPRFNARAMLELLRGKRLVFVGDSLNRNQWESMLCLLSEAIPDKTRVYEIHGRRITKGKGFYSFLFKDYRCTVEFYVTHFLVQEGKARIGRKRRQTLRIDKIDKQSSKWKGADFLIFNTAHWWSHSKTLQGRNYFQEGDKIYPFLDVQTAFGKALTTWARWVDSNVDARKTTIFFRSYSPVHFEGGQWNSGGGCDKQTQPYSNNTLKGHDPKEMEIVYNIIKHMKTPVNVLNVTKMTQFRKDGHPSIYGTPVKESLKGVVERNPQDCSHWCLPGVPDSWNELLYALLTSEDKLLKGYERHI